MSVAFVLHYVEGGTSAKPTANPRLNVLQTKSAGHRDKRLKYNRYNGLACPATVPRRDTGMNNSYFFILIHTYYGKSINFPGDRLKYFQIFDNQTSLERLRIANTGQNRLP